MITLSRNLQKTHPKLAKVSRYQNSGSNVMLLSSLSVLNTLNLAFQSLHWGFLKIKKRKQQQNYTETSRAIYIINHNLVNSKID